MSGVSGKIGYFLQIDSIADLTQWGYRERFFVAGEWQQIDRRPWIRFSSMRVKR